VYKSSNKDIHLHEVFEPVSVLFWLYRTQFFTVLHEQSGLQNPLNLLIATPVLQIVNDRQMVAICAIKVREQMFVLIWFRIISHIIQVLN